MKYDEAKRILLNAVKHADEVLDGWESEGDEAIRGLWDGPNTLPARKKVFCAIRDRFGELENPETFNYMILYSWKYLVDSGQAKVILTERHITQADDGPDCGGEVSCGGEYEYEAHCDYAECNEISFTTHPLGEVESPYRKKFRGPAEYQGRGGYFSNIDYVIDMALVLSDQKSGA